MVQNYAKNYLDSPATNFKCLEYETICCFFRTIITF